MAKSKKTSLTTAPDPLEAQLSSEREAHAETRAEVARLRDALSLTKARLDSALALHSGAAEEALAAHANAVARVQNVLAEAAKACSIK